MEPGTRNKEQGRQGGFRNLIAWQKADQLASAVFRLARLLRQSERWLGLQMLRASVSVPANIAEGYGRGTLTDYIRFLELANGSLNETEYYLHFLTKNGILTEEQVKATNQVQHETGAVLSGLLASLRKKRREDGESWRRGFLGEGRVRYLVQEEEEQEISTIFDSDSSTEEHEQPGSRFLVPGSFPTSE